MTASDTEPTTAPDTTPDGQTLAERYDVALLDLDGVVYRGHDPVVHAADALREARERGMRVAFVTNNALRAPEEVVERIRAAGVDATVEEVATSAQAAARLLEQQLPAGSRVLVAGGEGLRLAVTERGLTPVQRADEQPAGMVTGYDPEITYARLAEAVLAVFAGALWVASNTDATVPTERGLLPGAGATVAFVRAATKATPQVAGKPERALHEESIIRNGAKDPLVIGDRLDTDIEGANRAGVPSLLVLTGVSQVDDLLSAEAVHRPTFVGADLRALLVAAPSVDLEPADDARTARCGSWRVDVDGDALRWSSDGTGDPAGQAADDGLDAVRAGLALYWARLDGGHPVHGVSGDVPAGCEAFAG